MCWKNRKHTVPLSVHLPQSVYLQNANFIHTPAQFWLNLLLLTKTFTLQLTCLPIRSGGGHKASSSCITSESSIILFNSSMTDLWTNALQKQRKNIIYNLIWFSYFRLEKELKLLYLYKFVTKRKLQLQLCVFTNFTFSLCCKPILVSSFPNISS